ncbi:7151_t:CDS:2 [Cetraspora pellucida]|uniref:7151_t:CDS:1 n=1 Tax=Cetraspora pellucida TaxID=1433469 RepID=A0A9N9AF21_9GLOM|nr:7151_t:CDS:2 [Cetraspora pellucida]
MLGLGASVHKLSHKEVTNIKYKVHGPMEVHLIGNSDLKLDISESISYLVKQNVENDIIEEICKFLLPFQKLLAKEACAVNNRLEKGKDTLSLISLNCYCIFCNRYLLLCKHIFHEHMYSNKLLTSDVWKAFQEMFEENGFEIYESQESFIEYMQTKQQKETENQRIDMTELTKRVHDR